MEAPQLAAATRGDGERVHSSLNKINATYITRKRKEIPTCITLANNIGY